MPIQKNTSHFLQLTEYIVTGKVGLDGFMAELSVFYSGETTPYVLWDLTDAVLWNINAKDAEVLSSHRGRFLQAENRVKTAFVADHEHSFNLSTWFKQYGEMDRLTFQVEVFTSVIKAKEWLFESSQK